MTDKAGQISEPSSLRPMSSAIVGYFWINIVFLIVVSLLSIFSKNTGHNPALYLVLLLTLLSSPLLFVRNLTGPFVVLVVASPLFFLMYGLPDLIAYISGPPWTLIDLGDSILTDGELGVLIAFLSLYMGYVGAVKTLKSKSDQWFHNDWNLSTILFVGLVCFSVGMFATFVSQIQFSISQTHTPQVGTLAINAIVLGRMLGDVGEVLLAYASIKSKKRAIFILVVSLIALKLPLGIILNAKHIGTSFVFAYLIVAWFYNGKIPWRAACAGGLAILLMFPLAYEYRHYMSKHSVSVGETLNDVSGHLNKALNEEISDQKEKGLMDTLWKGVESFSGRANLKPLMELIITRVGVDRPYKNGYTLTPLLYVLIPRLVLPEKPDVPVGQLFNQEFKISASPDTWISTSFMGELYWNFSWVGLVAGMLIIGYTYGAMGSIANMENHKSVSRVLILLITMYTLVFKFQTGIAQQYSIFIRTLIIVVIMHMLFQKRQSD